MAANFGQQTALCKATEFEQHPSLWNLTLSQQMSTDAQAHKQQQQQQQQKTDLTI